MERKSSRPIDSSAVQSAPEGQRALQSEETLTTGSGLLREIRELQESRIEHDPELQAKTYSVAGKNLVKAIELLDPNQRTDFEQIAALGRIGKRLIAQIEAIFDDAIRSADKAHKNILKVKNEAISHFEEAEALSKQLLAEGHERHDEYEADGAIFSDQWKAEIVNAQDVPREFLVPDMTKINGIVKALKDETRIPGVRAVRKTQVALRANE